MLGEVGGASTDRYVASLATAYCEEQNFAERFAWLEKLASSPLYSKLQRLYSFFGYGKLENLLVVEPFIESLLPDGYVSRESKPLLAEKLFFI